MLGITSSQMAYFSSSRLVTTASPPSIGMQVADIWPDAGLTEKNTQRLSSFTLNALHVKVDTTGQYW